jgi:uncharacterized repeat protein (TIGR01451 family)
LVVGIAVLGAGVVATSAAGAAGTNGSSQWATAVSGTYNAAGTMSFGTSGLTASVSSSTNGCGGATANQVSNAALTSFNANAFYTPTAPSDAVGVNQCLLGGRTAVRTVTFNKPVISPMFNTVDLDASNLTFSAGPSGGAIQLATVSKNAPFNLIGGTTLSDTYNQGTANCADTPISPGNDPGCGTFRMTEAGGPVSSFTMTNTTKPALGSDGWYWSLSFPTASLTKAFTPASIPVGTTSALAFTLTNPTNPGQPTLSSLDFTDALPAGLTLADGSVSTNGNCGAPSVADGGGGALGAGDSAVKASNISVAVGAQCTIVVNVTSTTTGMYTNNNSNMSTGVANVVPAANTTLTVTPPPDLMITKSASPATVEPGGQVTWTLTVRNIGSGPSAAATVEDTIPAAITNVSAPGCTVGASTVTCPVGSLAVGASSQITLTGTAPSTTSTCFTNTATVTAAGDQNASNNSAQATSCTRPPLADVRITKSASPTTVLQGNQVHYTLTVTNDGPDPSQGVRVTDAPAAGVSPVSATPSQGSCANASSCSLGTLAVGQTATIQVEATATALGTQGNTAAVSTTTAENDPSNNTASATIVVEPEADLRITKTASQATLTEGDDFTYTMTVRNAGPSTAVDAVVSDSVPAGVSVRSIDAPRGSCTQGDPVICQLGDLANGATATITIHATASQAGSPVNTAIVSSPTPDPDTTNNQDSTRVTTNARADLSITKTASAQSVLLGESFTYTLRIRNDGPSAAVNTVVTDRIPDGLGLEVASSSKGSCGAAPVVVCQLGTLAKGDSETIQLTVTTLKAGTVDNTASVTSETPDPDPDDNLDDAHVEVGTRADLSIDKDTSSKTVTAGDHVVYGLVVTNKGPHDAANVTVTDPVPAGMRVVSAKPSTGSCTTTGGAVVTCDLDDLPNGASVTIRVEMVAEQAGSTRNVASVTSPTPDPDTTNNLDETEVTTETADVSLTKTGPSQPVNLGAGVSYRLTVRNAGPSGARGVVVTDPIPDGLRVTKTTASAGSCTVVEEAVVCQIGDLAANATATVTVTADAVRQGRGNNAASVIATYPSDPNPRNNSDNAKTTVKPGPAKVSLTKKASRSLVSPGGRIGYRIVVRNQGARTAHDLRVCDDLPAGLSYVNHPGAKLRNGQACWTIPTLAAHSTRRFTVTARALGGQPGRLVNVARLSGSNVKAARDTAGVRRVLGERRAGGVTG